MLGRAWQTVSNSIISGQVKGAHGFQGGILEISRTAHGIGSGCTLRHGVTLLESGKSHTPRHTCRTLRIPAAHRRRTKDYCP